MAMGTTATTAAIFAAVDAFTEFPKIHRLSRDMVVTEKIDGTNAQICIGEDGTVRAGSRSRWITPDEDNFGFAAWVRDNEAELRNLGPGRHFGEWWGAGIQRRYGLAARRFSLFNTSRWTSLLNTTDSDNTVCVECSACHVVPILRSGVFDTAVIESCLTLLGATGSAASPGFMKPEGIVVYHVASNTMFKKTLDKNDGHKGSTNRGRQQ
jgi:hypothetical protein